MSHGDDLEFQFLVASANRSLRQLSEHFQLPRHGAFSHGRALAVHIADALGALESEVALADSKYAAATSVRQRSSHHRKLRYYNQLIRLIHGASRYMSSAQSPPVPLGVVYFVTEAARRLVGTDTEIIFVRDPNYMYLSRSWPFSDVITGHLKRAAPVGVRPIVLHFPHRESSSVLLHTLFVHEIAHSATEQHGLVDKVFSLLMAESWFSESYSATIKDQQSALGVSEKKAIHRVSEWVRGWLDELLCDALAADLLGPSYVFAFAAFLLPSRWNECSDSHPPVTLRTRHLQAHLSSNGWDTVMAPFANISAWISNAAAAERDEPLTSQHEFLHDMAERAGVMVRAVSRKHLGGDVFTPTGYARESHDLVALLDHGIVSGEDLQGEPFGRANLLLAYWLYRIAQGKDHPSMVLEALSDTGYQLGLARALEMSVTVEAWRASADVDVVCGTT